MEKINQNSATKQPEDVGSQAGRYNVLLQLWTSLSVACKKHSSNENRIAAIRQIISN